MPRKKSTCDVTFGPELQIFVIASIWIDSECSFLMLKWNLDHVSALLLRGFTLFGDYLLLWHITGDNRLRQEVCRLIWWWPGWPLRLSTSKIEQGMKYTGLLWPPVIGSLCSPVRAHPLMWWWWWWIYTWVQCGGSLSDHWDTRRIIYLSLPKRLYLTLVLQLISQSEDYHTKAV